MGCFTLLEAQQFDQEFLTLIVEVAREMEDIKRDSTKWKLLKEYLTSKCPSHQNVVSKKLQS